MPLDAPSSVELKPLDFITAFHAVRPLNPAYVERLRQKVRAIGVKPYPLSVTPAGVLFGGRHRYEAFKAEGITECLMHISEPASLDREAIELNRASEDALPMTFVNYAEMVWRKQDAGATQKAVAEEMGWSRSAVADYETLRKITPKTWSIVATFQVAAVSQSEDVATRRCRSWRSSAAPPATASWPSCRTPRRSAWIPAPATASASMASASRAMALTAPSIWPSSDTPQESHHG